jgi:curved DNA-binding protein CbpA
MEDYYRILGVSHHATKTEIKENFHKLAHIYHPDKNKNHESNEKFREINEAYSTLIDDKKRKDYDSGLNISEPPTHKDYETRKPKKSRYSHLKPIVRRIIDSSVLCALIIMGVAYILFFVGFLVFPPMSFWCAGCWLPLALILFLYLNSWSNKRDEWSDWH